MKETVEKRYGTEADVEAMTGLSRRTLQKDRTLGIDRFPYYKIGRKVLYDLDEVDALIRKTRTVGSGRPFVNASGKAVPFRSDPTEANARLMSDLRERGLV